MMDHDGPIIGHHIANVIFFSYGLRRADGSTQLRYKGVQMQQLEGDNCLSFDHLSNLLYASPRAADPTAPITNAQHAVAACLELNNEVNVQAPCIEVPVR